MNVGDTILCGPPDKKWHLYFAVADTEDGNLILFNVTTYDSTRDTSCVIKVGEHPFITHKSMVKYIRGLEWNPAAQAIAEAEFGLDVPAQPMLIRKIRLGALKSPHVQSRWSNEIRRALSSC